MRLHGRQLLDAHATFDGDQQSDRILLITSVADLERLDRSLNLTRLRDPRFLVHLMDVEVGSVLRAPVVIAIRYLATCLDLARPDHLMLVENERDGRVAAGGVRFVPDGTEGHSLVITVRLSTEKRKRPERRFGKPSSARTAAREGAMSFTSS